MTLFFSDITTTAVKDGDDFIINGVKLWITSGTQADWMCLLANTGGENHHFNKSLICLPLDTKGRLWLSNKLTLR